jgi:hypothetical protein
MSSKNLLKKLIHEVKLRRQETDIVYLQNLLDAAKRNFDAASLIKGKIDDAAFKLFYDGLLQLGRVILLLNGLRPVDGEQHKTTFTVTGEFLGKDFVDLINKIQRYCIKRNDCVYDPKVLISRVETEAIHKTAQEFWRRIRLYLSEKDPQLRLFEEI